MSKLNHVSARMLGSNKLILLVIAVAVSILAGCATDIETGRTKLPYIDDKPETSKAQSPLKGDKPGEKNNSTTK